MNYNISKDELKGLIVDNVKNLYRKTVDITV